jgi:hypothetical protein
VAEDSDHARRLDAVDEFAAHRAGAILTGLSLRVIATYDG